LNGEVAGWNDFKGHDDSGGQVGFDDFHKIIQFDGFA
jgi:hypothetical protein